MIHWKNKIVLLLLPILVEVGLSLISEQNFFRAYAFLYPFYFAAIALFFTLKENMTHKTIGLLSIGLMSHFTYGFAFYAYQQNKFTNYTQGENLPVGFNGFMPYILAIVVNIILLLGLGLLIACTIFIIKQIKDRSTKD